MSLLAKKPDLQKIAADLLQCYGPDSENADFFENDAVVIDCSKVKAAVTVTALSALMKALVDCRLKPIAFRGFEANDDALALALGLVLAPVQELREKTAITPKKASQSATGVVKEIAKEVIREVPGPATMVIEKPVRSGQKIYARGADLIVLAMVNQGGEVVADGNIHVYAPLRGKAMAGASGNNRARIFSTCLEPELISIAGVYRTSENPLPPGIQGKAAQIRLSDDGQEKLLFEALNH